MNTSISVHFWTTAPFSRQLLINGSHYHTWLAVRMVRSSCVGLCLTHTMIPNIKLLLIGNDLHQRVWLVNQNIDPNVLVNCVKQPGYLYVEKYHRLWIEWKVLKEYSIILHSSNVNTRFKYVFLSWIRL